MKSLSTPRLLLRPLAVSDARFALQLLNEPSWLQNIGDRGVRSLGDAERFLREGHWTRYAEWGFGFLGVERREQPGLMGVCGMARRPHLDAPDLGYAFLPAFTGQGFALEAAQAVMAWAAELGMRRVLATVRAENQASRRLLARLGMREEGELMSPDGTRRLLRYAGAPRP